MYIIRDRAGKLMEVKPESREMHAHALELRAMLLETELSPEQELPIGDAEVRLRKGLAALAETDMDVVHMDRANETD